MGITTDAAVNKGIRKETKKKKNQKTLLSSDMNTN